MALKARTIMDGRIAILELRGALVGDGETDELRNAVADFIEQGNKYLVINLQKVNYMNSSGIGAIIAAHTSYAKNGGEVRLAAVSANIESILVITRLVDVFDVYDTTEEAVQSFLDMKST